ncbi:DUF3592 domain-containing protein [Haloarcula onubensis]|uniref:DUF3592 domain-containing protein n=1 Tax=Haloarcula onubensis TaxID=2950539 RepID=A0ABU2FJE6_9EURY|nr:DUF3592 domain-containing protein [Halomicroarcula sp. S3CR25-11]MDS0280857.1 DUF3592 domain-containing protein [Halomicroarcula sp. S3CR25-11]
MSSGGERDRGRRSGMGLPVQPPKPGTAMSAFVLLVGLGIVGVGAYSYVTDSAALDGRVQVTAEVTETGVEEVTASRGRDAYVPVVTFRYEYQGTTYTSNRLYPGQSQPQYQDRATAQERVSAYAVGQRVPAYVDPDAPGAAFLEDSRSGQPTGAFFVGLAVSLVGAVGLYQARAEARARELLP